MTGTTILLAHAGGIDEFAAVALVVAVLAWGRWRLRRGRLRLAPGERQASCE